MLPYLSAQCVEGPYCPTVWGKMDPLRYFTIIEDLEGAYRTNTIFKINRTLFKKFRPVIRMKCTYNFTQYLKYMVLIGINCNLFIVKMIILGP